MFPTPLSSKKEHFGMLPLFIRGKGGLTAKMNVTFFFENEMSNIKTIFSKNKKKNR